MAASAKYHAALFEHAMTAARAAIDATGRHDRGSCGFAWVEVHPATSSFARWCRANGHGQPARRGLWVNGFSDYRGQSVDVAEAGAKAFATVLSQAGINAVAHSRLD